MKYRVDIDQGLCDSYGNCVIAAPEVFDLDEQTNIAVVRHGHPVDSDAEALLDAAAQCPVQAIRVVRQALGD